MKHYNHLHKVVSICVLLALILFQLSSVFYTTSVVQAAGNSTGNYVLTTDASIKTADAGVYNSDVVWLDMNKNGLQDANEAGVPGVTVWLYQSGPDDIAGSLDDLLIAMMTTDPAGSYHFTGLPAGDYFVQFDLPPGYARTAQDVGGNTPASDMVDSDADITTGLTPISTLTPGENVPTWDAGIYIIGIGDRVWFDQNANGIQDSGEPGLPGVSVALYTSAGVPVGAPVTTDANGNYAFLNLPSGDYYVQVTPPSGYSVSLQDAGTDDQIDSDIDPTTGQTAITTLSLNQSDPTWDAGLYQLVSVGDLIWNDSNNNGLVDGDEAGIDGVMINLFLLVNDTGEMGTNEFVAVHTKSVGGRYKFTSLQPGVYQVELDAANFAPGGPLAGYTSSTGRIGTNISPGGPYEPAPSPDGDINNDDNGTDQYGVIASGPITLAAGAEPLGGGNTDPNHNPTVDFGLLLPIQLGSTVWNDINGNGIKGPGEQGIPNVVITLYDAANTVLATTTTNATGIFQFDALPAGSYQIGVSNIPAGFSFTLQNRGDDASDSDVDPTTGRTALVALVPGDNNQTLFAGLTQVPTAITVASFSAMHAGGAADGAMVIRWTTGMELNTFGFQLYRSATGTRADAVSITATPVLALGRAGSGADYRWVDGSAQPGVSYTYWLAEIELNGTTTEYGPARGSGPASAAFTLYLPLMGH